MTDRIKGVFVAFDTDYRDDDAEVIMDAIRMIKGVKAVEANVANPDDWMNRDRIKRELLIKLERVLRDD